MRNTIYELHLTIELEYEGDDNKANRRPSFCVIACDPGKAAKNLPSPATRYPAILHASHEARLEALPIFYDQTTFVFRTWEVRSIIHWIRAVVQPSGCGKHIRRITIVGYASSEEKIDLAMLCILAANGTLPALLGEGIKSIETRLIWERHLMCWLAPFAYDLLQEESDVADAVTKGSLPPDALRELIRDRLLVWFRDIDEVDVLTCLFERCPLDHTPPRPISSWMDGRT